MKYIVEWNIADLHEPIHWEFDSSFDTAEAAIAHMNYEIETTKFLHRIRISND